MLLPSVESPRCAGRGADAEALPQQAPNSSMLLRRISPLRAADGAATEQDHQGSALLHLGAENTAMSRCKQAGTAAGRVADTMSRPVSLGEVLGWSAARRSGLTLPSASPFSDPHPGTCTGAGLTVLSAWQGERFVMRHGDNYGQVQVRRGDRAWENVGAVADYMPAGNGRRYLREVGNAYGEFQLQRNGAWVSESAANGRQVRLYLIDGRFEMLTDEQHGRRGGPPLSQNDGWRCLHHLSLGHR